MPVAKDRVLQPVLQILMPSHIQFYNINSARVEGKREPNHFACEVSPKNQNPITTARKVDN